MNLDDVERCEAQRRQYRIGWYIACLVSVGVLCLHPLVALMRYAAESDLHSHILVVPGVVMWLLYGRRSQLRVAVSTAISPAVGCAIAAMACVISANGGVSKGDIHSLWALALVCFVWAGGFLFMGFRWMRAAAFPLTFLLFAVPLPDPVVGWLEEVSVTTSTDVAAMFLSVSGTPFVRTDTVFDLPGISLRVAEECSGIRSSWVLFITATLIAHIELKSRWRRALLMAVAIPLAIMRNGFRVFVLAVLCVHMGPQMINTFIHHQGGPIFFVLSLVPLLGLLWWLRKADRLKRA